jgi:hypothetical protein
VQVGEDVQHPRQAEIISHCWVLLPTAYRNFLSCDIGPLVDTRKVARRCRTPAEKAAHIGAPCLASTKRRRAAISQLDELRSAANICNF